MHQPSSGFDGIIILMNEIHYDIIFTQTIIRDSNIDKKIKI